MAEAVLATAGPHKGALFIRKEGLRSNGGAMPDTFADLVRRSRALRVRAEIECGRAASGGYEFKMESLCEFVDEERWAWAIALVIVEQAERLEV